MHNHRVQHDTDNDIVSLAGLRTRLHVPDSWIVRLVREGVIPVVRTPSGARYSVADVSRALRDRFGWFETPTTHTPRELVSEAQFCRGSWIRRDGLRTLLAERFIPSFRVGDKVLLDNGVVFTMLLRLTAAHGIGCNGDERWARSLMAAVREGRKPVLKLPGDETPRTRRSKTEEVEP